MASPRFYPVLAAMNKLLLGSPAGAKHACHPCKCVPTNLLAPWLTPSWAQPQESCIQSRQSCQTATFLHEEAILQID